MPSSGSARRRRAYERAVANGTPAEEVNYLTNKYEYSKKLHLDIAERDETIAAKEALIEHKNILIKAKDDEILELTQSVLDQTEWSEKGMM